MYLKQYNIYVVLGSLNAYLKKDFERYPNCKVYEFIDQKELASLFDIADI